MTHTQEPVAELSATIDLADRYRADGGLSLMTGVQAIARQLVEQHERDRRAGRRTATFVSGYQGSPLAGLDRLLAGIPELRTDHDVHLEPGLNEELAATAVFGSQSDLPVGESSHDGIVGIWYGKGPGLDRASDAIRHATMFGANPRGGVVAYVGDDPSAKSSSVPCASERSLAALGMPVFYPRNAEEVIRFGLYGVALSRAAGCWSGIKVVTDVADGLFTVDRTFEDLDIVIPEVLWQGRPWSYVQRKFLVPPDCVLAEADMIGPRWEMIKAFNAANEIDAIEVESRNAWIGIAAVGMCYDTLRQVLSELGLPEDADVERAGIRILRVGMPYPIGEAKVRQLAEGVESILVIEEKVSFVEAQIRDVLYGSTNAPVVLGKADGEGRRLIPGDGDLTTARLLGPLRRMLKDRVTLQDTTRSPIRLEMLDTKRSVYFCSGCPHNRSTAVPEGSIAGGGIGCHAMVTMSPRQDSQVVGLTQMGGEGSQWIGQAPFTTVNHIFQNIGDGTFFHSGQLAVQACIAAGVNITYKVLYNSAVAMTGAQDAEGALEVPALAHKLLAEGVARIIVCAEEPKRHKRSAYPKSVDVWSRDRLDDAQDALRNTPGVTVLIYDQQCAAEARRRRKRGIQPERTTKVMINEAVCEGCGDCGVKSNCLSVQPVETEYGRKTRIDQTSCNTDYSCLQGDCPSFVTVEVASKPKQGRTRRKVPEAPFAPDPQLAPIGESYSIFLAGIGGTGIVTVNQILGVAAMRAGLRVHGLDQTGLSQKAGPVTSHLRLSANEIPVSNRISAGSADCVLALDALTAADSRYVTYGQADRTITVASTSETPTGAMVYDPTVAYPSTEELLGRLNEASRTLFTLDALAVAEELFGNSAAANLIVVGAAFQLGAIPIPAEALEAAIDANGVAVALNLAAFRWGRVAVADPETFAQRSNGGSKRRSTAANPPPPRLMSLTSATGATREVIETRVAQLIGYQDERLAESYIRFIERVWQAEREIGERTDLTVAVAKGLHKLMAYKDEYEVARLLTDQGFAGEVREAFPTGSKVTFQLHPPVLRAMGRKKKVGFGPGSHGILRLLAKGKRVRGTRLDPFGAAKVRKVERALVLQYQALVGRGIADLTPASYDRMVDAASAAELVRGYEDIKLRNVEVYLERLADLGFTGEQLDV